MEYFIISITAFIIAGLTLFSGFGIGTVLTPVFALFFPVPVAISITAIVHFLNNLFKLALVGKFGDKETAIKFGIPAILGAIAGAAILSYISQKSFIINYQLFTHYFTVELVNLVIGILILFFALLEIIPQIRKISFSKKYLSIGGVLSGFFGGLSGNQGAFRSIFLLKSGLSKEQFIATGVVIAVIVDIIRLLIYGTTFLAANIADNLLLIISATLSAFLGSYLARRYMGKITIDAIRIIIVVLLLIISFGLIFGLI